MNLISTPPQRGHSAWQRSRYWSTAAFMVALMLSTVLLVHGHHLHGGLTLLAAGQLLRHTVLSRRARRHDAVIRMRRAYVGAGHAASK
jgi:hypothetical protein